MGKKKGGAGSGGPKRAFRKDPVATKMAASGLKKTKTKVVSTSLKRMKFQNRSLTESVDAQFALLQQEKKGKPKTAGNPARAGAAKAEAESVLKPEASSKSALKSEVEAEPDVDMAADEISYHPSV